MSHSYPTEYITAQFDDAHIYFMLLDVLGESLKGKSVGLGVSPVWNPLHLR